MEILSKLLNSRLIAIIFITIIAISCVILYLFNLQVLLSHNFYRLGQRNYLRYEKIESPRGDIVDCNGILLATNKPIYSLFWQGTGNKKISKNQELILQKFYSENIITQKELDDIIDAEKKSKKICFAYDINFEQLCQITERFPYHENIIVENQFKRFYPHNTLASHILGYLGFNLESHGKMGLESVCNNSLKGQSGQVIKTINSIGHYTNSFQLQKAKTGQTIKTTINFKVQSIIERLFPHNISGSCIIIDPKTGAIEALLSRPSFDPNIFLDNLDHIQWQKLQENKCFINRAFNSCYPPASLFKLVTFAAAFETKLISKDSTWHCCGHYDFAGRPYHCKKREGHGMVNTVQALTHSCNIPFYDIGKKIKIDILADFAHRLGLGEKTQSIFNERTGLIPTSMWKKKVKGESWWPGETLSASIGQSFILITPLQAASMLIAICEGFLVRFRILYDEPIEKRVVNITTDTLEFLKNALKTVTNRGTARVLGSLANFDIYGKTGTAQTSDVSKCELGKQYLEHAWFAAYFKYKNFDPKVLVIFVENVGSSSFAIAIAHSLLKDYGELLDGKA